MSDQFIVLVPAEQSKRPSRDTLDMLVAAHRRVTESEAVRLKDFGERLQFIDCGDNFESISCPSCNAPLETHWWGHQMDHCWDEEVGFDHHAHALPCCGVPLSLDRLTYTPTQAFAHWFVSARTDRKALTEGEIASLESIAGFPLKVIYQRY